MYTLCLMVYTGLPKIKGVKYESASSLSFEKTTSDSQVDSVMVLLPEALKNVCLK